MKPKKWTAFFPVYFDDWERFLLIADSEQITQVLAMCLDYAQDRPVTLSDDPFVNDSFNIIIEKAESRAEVYSDDK